MGEKKMKQPPDVWYYDNVVNGFTMTSRPPRDKLYMIILFPHPDKNTRFMFGPIGSYSGCPSFYGYDASRCQPVPLPLAELLGRCADAYDDKMRVKYKSSSDGCINDIANPGEIDQPLYNLVLQEAIVYYKDTAKREGINRYG